MGNRFSDNKNQHASPPPRYVRASDVGTYLYCRRSWWLEHVVGRHPGELPRRIRGTQAHQRHGWWVWISQVLRTIALTVVVLAIIAGWAMWSGWLP